MPSVFAAPPQVVTLLTVGVVRPLLAPAGNCGRVSFRLRRQRVVADVLATSAHRPSHRKRRHYRRFIDAAPYLGLALGTCHCARMTDTPVSAACPGHGPLLGRQTVVRPSSLFPGTLVGSGRRRSILRRRNWSAHAPRSPRLRGPNSLPRRLPPDREADLCSRRVPRAPMPGQPPCKDWGADLRSRRVSSTLMPIQPSREDRGADPRSRRYPGTSIFVQPL